MAHRSNSASAYALAQGLGWFSIGLGIVELAAPGKLARFLGMKERTELIRTYGAREILTGVGILSQDDPVPWLWGRVGGDALDLSTLAMGFRHDHPRRPDNVDLAIAAVAGVMALDLICVQALSGRERRSPPRRIRDYSARRGMPHPPDVIRGAARDFPVPRDMRIPELMRPYPS
jgi:hypothetical protein